MQVLLLNIKLSTLAIVHLLYMVVNLTIMYCYCIRCDDGFSSPHCQPTVSVPSFKEEFEATLNSNRWPIVTGGSIINSGVASGNALVFNMVSYYS